MEIDRGAARCEWRASERGCGRDQGGPGRFHHPLRGDGNWPLSLHELWRFLDPLRSGDVAPGRSARHLFRSAGGAGRQRTTHDRHVRARLLADRHGCFVGCGRSRVGRHQLRQPHRRRRPDRSRRWLQHGPVEPALSLASGPGGLRQPDRSGRSERPAGEVRRATVKRVLFLAFALAACPRSPPPVIDSFTVDQPNPDVGAAVTFSYAVRGASTVSIEPAPGVVHASPVIVVPPAAGTFTLRATNKDGREPASVTAKMVARVGIPPSVSNFAVDKPSIVQGDSATLSWQGNAVNYSVSDGTSTFNVGPRRSLVVRPATNAAYTLQAVVPGGTSSAG